MKYFVLILIVSGVFFSCEQPVYSPKPRAYPKVEYPDKEYRKFDKDYCCFTFNYPVYTEIIKDSTFFEEKPVNPCWFDVFYPDFDCRIYCSYLAIDKEKKFEEFKKDAFDLAGWHNKKATYIDEIIVKRTDNIKGMVFNIEGPAASPMQFYLTDEVNHFFRGSVYFNVRPNPDSLAPVIDFVKEDVLKLIETFEWTK